MFPPVTNLPRILTRAFSGSGVFSGALRPAHSNPVIIAFGAFQGCYRRHADRFLGSAYNFLFPHRPSQHKSWRAPICAGGGSLCRYLFTDFFIGYLIAALRDDMLSLFWVSMGSAALSSLWFFQLA